MAKNCQRTKLDTSALAVPERVSVAIADIALRADGAATELSWDLRDGPRDGLPGRLLDRVLVQPVLPIVFRTSMRRLRNRVEKLDVRRGHH